MVGGTLLNAAFNIVIDLSYQKLGHRFLHCYHDSII
jgi:hypothetical protein